MPPPVRDVLRPARPTGLARPDRVGALAGLLAALMLVGCAATRDGDRSAARASDAAGDDSALRVLLVLTNQGTLGDRDEPTGLFLSEASHPWHVFDEAGFEVVLASPDGGPAPIDPRSLQLDDPENAAFVERFAEDGRVTETVSLAQVDPGAFDAVFFAGGHGTMWDFPTVPAVRTVAEGVHRRGGVLAAVCHGPAALVPLRDADGRPLVAGRRVTGFTNAEEDAVELTEAMPFLLETRLRELGAEFDGAASFSENVVVDGRLVTGQNPASARGAAEAVVVELLRGRG